MPVQKFTLKIIDMHCKSCAQKIENTLKKEKAINSANVNYASKKATISFNDDKINKQGLLQIKATKIGKNTFLSQVIKIVGEYQGKKCRFRHSLIK